MKTLHFFRTGLDRNNVPVYGRVVAGSFPTDHKTRKEWEAFCQIDNDKPVFHRYETDALRAADTTKVIFRISAPYGRTDVYALMPAEPGTNDPGTCGCFTFSGHTSADLSLCTYRDRLATKAEYADLKSYMENSYGYILRLMKRATRADYETRKN